MLIAPVWTAYSLALTGFLQVLQQTFNKREEFNPVDQP